MSMAGSTGSIRPVLVGSGRVVGSPRLSGSESASEFKDLTIHRITRTHHGRTLLRLGHAAEYLANSRRYSAGYLSSGRFDYEADADAIHILMRMSRTVFDELAEQGRLHCRVQDWLVARVVRVVEWGVWASGYVR
jgi:hypothetical protein